MTDYVLGVDIGSGSVKLTLLSREGKIAATAGCEYPTYYPHVGWCEQDPEDWCRAFKTAFGDILKTAGVGAERIKALSFDAATHTAVLLGEQKQVLRRQLELAQELDLDRPAQQGRGSGAEGHLPGYHYGSGGECPHHGLDAASADVAA